MKKWFCSLATLYTSSIFSFYKMSDVRLYEVSRQNGDLQLNENLQQVTVKYIPMPNSASLESNKMYAYYIYNSQLGYGVMSFPSENNRPPFKLLKQCQFDANWWKSFFYDHHRKKAFPCFYTNLPEEISFNALEDNMKDHGLSKQVICHLDIQYNLKYFNLSYPFNKQVISLNHDQKIEIGNNKDKVLLSNSSGQSIDFEQAFKNYVQRYSSFSIRFGAPFSELQNEILNQVASKKEAELVKKMLQESKISYSDDQIELLNRSKILAIWGVYPKRYSNKEYIKHEKIFNPDFIREEKNREVYSIVVGFAYDTKNNITYHWITDLGQDISALFSST